MTGVQTCALPIFAVDAVRAIEAAWELLVVHRCAARRSRRKGLDVVVGHAARVRGQFVCIHEPDTEAHLLKTKCLEPAVESQPQGPDLVLVLPRGDIIQRARLSGC